MQLIEEKIYNEAMIRSFLLNFKAQNKATTAMEYALIVSLISIVAIIAFESATSGLFTSSSSAVDVIVEKSAIGLPKPSL